VAEGENDIGAFRLLISGSLCSDTRRTKAEIPSRPSTGGSDRNENNRKENMNDRTTEIEIKLAHMEQALNELSDVIYAQQNVLDKLNSSHDALRQRLFSLEGGGDDSENNNEKPPHY
jgi:SlyX protein